MITDNKRRLVMLYFSFDLSFTGTGICLFDDNEKKISFWQVKTILDKKKTFESIQSGITSILQGIENIIAEYEQPSGLTLLMAQPFVGGCWSAGLYGLDSAFYQRWRQYIKKTWHPNTLKKIMGKHTKKDSINLAHAIITELESCGWLVNFPASKITDDQSEALIYNTLYHIEEKHQDFIEMYDTLNCYKIIK